MRRRPLSWVMLVVALSAANRLSLSFGAVADRPQTTLPRRGWSCGVPDCVCLGDDVTGSRAGELCVRTAEVGQLSASRLAAVKRLSVVGRSSSSLQGIVARRLSRVRSLQVVDGRGGVADWSRFFSALAGRLGDLTIRNSSTAAAAVAMVLSAGVRSLSNLRMLDLSTSSAIDVDLRSLQQLRDLEVLDVSGNSLTRLTAVNRSACAFYDEESTTSVFGLNSTSGLVSPMTTESTAEMCRQFNGGSNRLSSVRVLNANRNKIDMIDVGLFDRKSGRKLEVLDLSYNRLSRIDNQTFVDLYKLRTLNLSHNVISDIEVDAFTMTSDDELAHHDSATDVGYQATGKQREEQYYISLASCTRGWLSIQVVDLSYNKLTFLKEGLLEQALCAVRRLMLSNNQVARLPRYLLEHLPYLTYLDLSNNALTWLDVGAFTNPSLSVIDLSGNKLRKIVSMTFLYLPALRSVNLARNKISYVYKFAFYRMCSDASRPITVSLRFNQLDVDAVWKLLTTFEHLEDVECRVAVDLRDNLIERFLTAETLSFVRRRVVAAAADDEDAQTQLRHFRRWSHVTADLTGNRIHCDCVLASELRTIDTVLEMIGGNGTEPEVDLITKSWRRLECGEPIEHAGLSVGTFVNSIAPTMCQLHSTLRKSSTSYGACSTSASSEDVLTTVNCSGKHLSEFPTIATRASTSSEHGVLTLDLSHNQLRAIGAQLLRALFPSLRVLLLHDNRMTSLPVALIDGSSSLTSLTLAENPLTCDCSQPWLRHANVVRLSTLVADWHEAKCSDGRPLSRFSTADYRCAGPTASKKHHSDVVWSAGVTLVCVLIIAVVLALVWFLLRLARWAAFGLRRRTKIYDVVSVDGGTENSGSRWTMSVLVVYCGADDEWVRSKLTPLLRRSSTSMPGVVQLSLKTTDVTRRQFVQDLKRFLLECHLAVVVVSSNLVSEISRHDDAISGLLRDAASRCVYVSAGGGGDVGAADVQVARRAFGRGVWFVTSDDDVMERVRAEMTSAMTQQQQQQLPLQISRGHDDTDRQLTNDLKY